MVGGERGFLERLNGVMPFGSLAVALPVSENCG